MVVRVLVTDPSLGAPPQATQSSAAGQAASSSVVTLKDESSWYCKVIEFTDSGWVLVSTITQLCLAAGLDFKLFASLTSKRFDFDPSFP